MTRMYLWPSIVFVIVLAFLWQGLYLKPSLLPSSLIGKPVPKFLLPISGSNTELVNESILQGHISVMTVWASWCESCVNEHKMLSAQNKTDDFQLVGINYKDVKYNSDLWLNNFGNPYKVNILDTNGRLGFDLGVYGTPTTYIVDRAGIIRYRHVGILTKDSWNEIILPQINKLKT